MAHSPWTPELIAQVREYAAQGLSSNKISQLIGKSRNTVIGICQRQHIHLGMQMVNRVQRIRPAKPKVERKRRAVEARVSVVSLAKRAVRASLIPTRQVCAPDPAPQPTRSFPHKVRYFAISEKQCRFPLWGSQKEIPLSSRFFCGAPIVAEGIAYCSDCRAVMYRRFSEEAVAV